MISRKTGNTIPYLDQIRQSIQDILTTPIGSRVMRRVRFFIARAY